MKANKDAERYVRKNTAMAQALSDSPRLHFTPPLGWLNDPNGLVFYRGRYHLFYQFYPYETSWGQMHWGHAVSDDLLRWEHLPIALTPTEVYEASPKGGCFSGTAIVEGDRLYLFYTAVSEDSEGSLQQVQCGAWSDDGYEFHKFAENPLISCDNLGQANQHFRDPKVWQHEDHYYLLVGVSQQEQGKLLLYRSKDLLNWAFFSEPLSGDYGWMLECPDFFTIEERDILTFSPVGLPGQYTLYLVGKLDYQTGKFAVSYEGRLDAGVDFYAPQTLLNDQGERYMIAWQNGWEWMAEWRGFGSTKENRWVGSMSLPRKISLAEDRLINHLPETLTNQLQVYQTYSSSDAIEEVALPDPCIIQLRVTSGVASCELQIHRDDGATDVLAITGNTLSYQGLAGIQRRRPLALELVQQPTIRLQLVIDLFSMEVFQEGTDRALSVNCFGDERSRKTLTIADTTAIESLRISGIDFEKMMGEG